MTKDESKTIADLLNLVGRRLHSLQYAGGLNPAQWSALRYFSEANPSARTAIRFAENHMSTRGTAHHTTAVLERKGLLQRVSAPADQRTVQLDVTAAGRAKLECDPLKTAVAAVEALPDPQRRALQSGLTGLAQRLLRYDSSSSETAATSEGSDSGS